jgi:hydroxyacylglutathione hydrolase
MLEIITLPALTDNYIYILHDTGTGKTAAVDPAVAEPVLTLLEEKGWTLDYIYNTHHHLDHVGGNLTLKRHTNCQIVGAKADAHRIPGIDLPVDDGDTLTLGEQTLEIIATPGHTSGHIVYYFADEHALFCGDTLFSLGCGRLFEGTAEQLWQSLQRLKQLPENTRVYCAHEYTLANARFALSVEPDNPALQQRIEETKHLREQQQPSLPSTIGLERVTNPFFREHSLAIQANLDAMNHSALSIFTQLRALKDQFI